MAFNDTDVRDWVGATAFSRAVALAPQLIDLTLGEGAREGDLLANARTGCARAYDVTFRYAGGKLSSLCSCPDRRNCVHGAAVALAVRQREAAVEAAQVAWTERLAAWTAPAPAAAPVPKAHSRFAYCLRWPAVGGGEHELQLRVRMASSAVQALAWHLYKTELTDGDEDRLVETAIRRIRSRELQFRDGETATAVSWLVVPPDLVGELLTRLALHPNVEDGRRKPLVIHPALALQAGLTYQGSGDGLVLQPDAAGTERGRAGRSGAVRARGGALGGLRGRDPARVAGGGAGLAGPGAHPGSGGGAPRVRAHALAQAAGERGAARRAEAGGGLAARQAAAAAPAAGGGARHAGAAGLRLRRRARGGRRHQHGGEPRRGGTRAARPGRGAALGHGAGRGAAHQAPGARAGAAVPARRGAQADRGRLGGGGARGSALLPALDGHAFDPAFDRVRGGLVRCAQRADSGRPEGGVAGHPGGHPQRLALRAAG